MDAKAIETFVRSYLDQSIQGLDKENPKFDFKAGWYNLKDPQDISEFLKDTTSIVNTFGPDGLIVIGFDDRKKAFTQATFKDCQLRDSSDIINLINGKVDRLFVVNTLDIDVNGNKLSVIHIPPSLDKPHVIRSYVTYNKDRTEKNREENKIWVRKNSRTTSASKYDIDLMYYDRKNISPEYELHSNFHLMATTFNINGDNQLMLTSRMTIENSGRRPVAIAVLALEVQFGTGDSIEIFKMTSGQRYFGSNLIVRNGEILNDRVELYCDEPIRIPKNHNRNMRANYFNAERSKMKYSTLEITMANGTVYSSGLKIIQ